VLAVLDLGGGLRLLVIEALIAYTMLNFSRASNIALYTVLEGRNELVNIDIASIKKKLAASRVLSGLHKAVLKIVEEKGVATPREVLDNIRERGVTITKQRLAKILTKLANLGLIEKIERGKYRYKP